MPRDPLSLQPGYHKEFLEIFRSIGRHHGRYERFADFLELATCAIRKITVPPGSEAEAFEERYMKVVARYPPDDIRTMPKLLALTQLAVASGGCDFLGTLASEFELLDAKLGQLITPTRFHSSLPNSPCRTPPPSSPSAGSSRCKSRQAVPAAWSSRPPMSSRQRASIRDRRCTSKPSIYRHCASR